MRADFSAETISFSQATFLLADSGSILLSSNSSATNWCTAISKIQVVFASVDSVLPSTNDLDLFLPLLASYKNGNIIHNNIELLSGTRKENEPAGADELYVVIIDNGRSNVIEQEVQRQVMHCIQCGACQSACPVYESVGHASYKHSYSGPTGAVALPLINNFNENITHTQASTLCGQCTDSCPVGIDFKKGILLNRQQAVAKKIPTSREKWFYYLWKKTMLKRTFINLKGVNARKHVIEKIFLNSPNGNRTLPQPAAKTFNEQWRERMNLK